MGCGYSRSYDWRVREIDTKPEYTFGFWMWILAMFFVSFVGVLLGFTNRNNKENI